MANDPVRPRIMDFLARQAGFVHVGGIARGAQVSPPSVRKVLRELEQAGRLEVRPAGEMPGLTGAGYRLRLGDPARELPSPSPAVKDIFRDADAGGRVAAYARSCLAALRWDRDWLRVAVTQLEAAGERIVQTEEPAAEGSGWTVLDWRTGTPLATITGGQDDYAAAWPNGWTDVAWIGAWTENLADGNLPGPEWPEALPPPPAVPDPPAPLGLPLPASLAGRLEEVIGAWAAEAAVIPGRAAEVASLTGWTKDQVLACTGSWLTITGKEYMLLGGAPAGVRLATLTDVASPG